MSPGASPISRIYIHRRLVVRFLIVMLVMLSLLSFAFIGFGWGRGSTSEQQDYSMPTQLADKSAFYVLLIGSDSLEGTALYGGDIDENAEQVDQHADTLVLARIDPASLKVTLVTVPANTVLYDSDEQARDSLRDGGPIQAVYTVERITGVDVRYYFMLDFSGFEGLVSRVGKINANVPETIKIQDPVTAKSITVKKGDNQKLNASETLAFVRAWQPYENDFDAHRQLNARKVIIDIINQVLGFEDEKVRKVLGSFEYNCATDMNNEQLISLVTYFYQNKDAVSIHACTGPYLTTNISANGEPIIRQPVSAWRELMTVVDAGEDPAAVFPEYDFGNEHPDETAPEEDMGEGVPNAEGQEAPQ